MKLYYPDFYPDFSCTAGACPDSCCRQGWEIPVDEEHVAFYRSLQGELGKQVRSALVRNRDGETVLRMENGTCALLRPDGLCPIAALLGEDGLCGICHTHPRFLEEYGGTREYHLSLSCPEAARLSLMREKPIRFLTEYNEECVNAPNSIDPNEYGVLLALRQAALTLVQDRRLWIHDRMALLLQLANRLQPLLEDKRWKSCQNLLDVFPSDLAQKRQLAATRRWRLKGASWFPEWELLLSLEHLSADFPGLVRDAVFTARDGAAFDMACSLSMEHLLSLWLAHYIPKAVNDGRADTKIRLCVLLAMTVRRFCICQKNETADGCASIAGLLAKELEHSEDNMAALYAALENQGWHEHLLKQLPVKKEGAAYAI